MSVNGGKNTYPVGKGDPELATRNGTDEGLSNVKYEMCRNNFLPSAMVFTKRDPGTQPLTKEATKWRDTDDDDSFSNTLHIRSCKVIRMQERLWSYFRKR